MLCNHLEEYHIAIFTLCQFVGTSFRDVLQPVLQDIAIRQQDAIVQKSRFAGSASGDDQQPGKQKRPTLVKGRASELYSNFNPK